MSGFRQIARFFRRDGGDSREDQSGAVDETAAGSISGQAGPPIRPEVASQPGPPPPFAEPEFVVAPPGIESTLTLPDAADLPDEETVAVSGGGTLQAAFSDTNDEPIFQFANSGNDPVNAIDASPAPLIQDGTSNTLLFGEDPEAAPAPRTRSDQSDDASTPIVDGTSNTIFAGEDTAAGSTGEPALLKPVNESTLTLPDAADLPDEETILIGGGGAFQATIPEPDDAEPRFQFVEIGSDPVNAIDSPPAAVIQDGTSNTLLSGEDTEATVGPRTRSGQNEDASTPIEDGTSNTVIAGEGTPAGSVDEPATLTPANESTLTLPDAADLPDDETISIGGGGTFQAAFQNPDDAEPLLQFVDSGNDPVNAIDSSPAAVIQDGTSNTLFFGEDPEATNGPRTRPGQNEDAPTPIADGTSTTIIAGEDTTSGSVDEPAAVTPANESTLTLPDAADLPDQETTSIGGGGTFQGAFSQSDGDAPLLQFVDSGRDPVNAIDSSPAAAIQDGTSNTLFFGEDPEATPDPRTRAGQNDDARTAISDGLSNTISFAEESAGDTSDATVPESFLNLSTLTLPEVDDLPPGEFLVIGGGGTFQGAFDRSVESASFSLTFDDVPEPSEDDDQDDDI